MGYFLNSRRKICNFLFWIFKGDLTKISYAKFHGLPDVGIFQKDLKFNMLLSPSRIFFYAFKVRDLVIEYFLLLFTEKKRLQNCTGTIDAIYLRP